MAPKNIKGVEPKDEKNDLLNPKTNEDITIDIKEDDTKKDDLKEDIIPKTKNDNQDNDNQDDDNQDDDEYFTDVEAQVEEQEKNQEQGTLIPPENITQSKDNSDNSSLEQSTQSRDSPTIPDSTLNNLYQNEENDLVSESDIDSNNSTYNFLFKMTEKINKAKNKKTNFKNNNDLDGIIVIINKFLCDIRSLKRIKAQNKKYLISLKVRLQEIYNNLTENKKPIDNNYFKNKHTEILTIYKDFKTNNQDALESLKNDKLRMNIYHERDFNKHLESKLNLLSERLNLLQMKYNGYKKWYDRTNITIIVISTLLSVFESFRLELQDLIDENNHALNIFFNMTPIIISSTITCSAAVIKFKKYQEKMENMQFTKEKVITSISRIEEVQESLWFNDEEDFKEIKKNYLKEIYSIVNESNTELNRHIKFDDHHKFDKHINNKNKEKNKNKNKNIYI